MKTKFNQKPEVEKEDDDIVEVEDTGTGVAAAKKGKVTLVIASSLLITVVIYFLFFKTEEAPERLEQVETPRAYVAPSESGKSPFDISEEKPSSDVELLKKPATPDIPALPELSNDNNLIDDNMPAAGNQNMPGQPQLNQPQIPTVQPIQQPQVQQPQQQQAQLPSTQDQQAPENTQVKKELNPRYAPIVVFSGGAGAGGTGAPERGVGYENNIVKLNEDPIDNLQKTKSTVVTTYIADRAHTIAQGKLLTAVLETAINTEIPGLVRAVVSRDVYGEAGREVLIPKGSRLFGAYSSKISKGQGRVDIGWSRLIRPDGVDLAISFKAADQFGRSGLVGDVDNKYNAIITNSMLTSILAVGGVAMAQKLLTNNTATTTTTNPTQGTTTTTGSATNQALYDVSKTIIDTIGQVVGSAIDINPVIRVPQGTRVTVIVNADITIPSMKR